ncbi:MAG TPA: HD domain-containing protein [Pyrinomonadaceae bacterium]|nr:HD domain-containing protein [Chloracidobacterium sp.]MBP9108004.1 HD domain-containing protein [Pyrinomonadaceae bacterium]MBL0241991.1 HD domain-containing protein [Chloracidobacterium sp.]HQX54806.1 HD domain-containing protein [Pyrinomonadaceae bacterium]HQY66230.1 HD domain-containing protein [Pyrinomonadaceae bacterium]
MIEQRTKLIHAFGALADLGQEVANKNNFQETIRTALHLISGSLAIMRGGVARYSRFGHELNMLAVRGLGDDFPLSLSLCLEDERQFLANGLNPIETAAARVLPFFQVYDRSFESRRIELFVPLVIRDEIVGAVFLGEKATGEAYTSYEKEIICAMGRHIGVAISQRNLMAEIERHSEENRRLFEGLRTTYNDTVKAFAAAIDCKDKYTEGHSVRVGRYSEIIAAELDWSPDQVEGAATAGYLHDVGKLTVERKIINAPYRINAKESAELNKHPSVGFEILQPIHHPYTDVPLAAKYHHERLDGRGYPDGLYDREIPYIAKIVNLGDSFDAMTTDRPYKARRPANDVVEDLRRNAGKQFAPELVTAFLRGMLKELTGESKDKRFRRMLGREYMEAEGIVPTLRNTLNEMQPTTTLTYIATDIATDQP